MKWPIKKLSELSELITKGTTPTSLGFSYASSGVRFLRAQNINYGNVNFYDNDLYIDVGTHNALARSQIKNGDLLVSIAGSIGRSGIVVSNNEPLNCNQAVAIVRLKKEVNEKYISHVLDSQALKNQIRSSTVTGVISNLSLSQLGNLTIPLPPLAEQQRIAALLDTADRILKLRESSIAKLDDLEQSIFSELINCSNTEDEIAISAVTKNVKTVNPSQIFADKKFTYIDISSVSNETKTIISENMIIGIDAPSRARQEIEVNDVLVSTVRPNLNAVAKVDHSYIDPVASTGFCVLRCDTTKILPQVIFSAVKSNKFIEAMVKSSTGASYPAVTDKVVKSYKLPKIAMKDQIRFAEFISICEIKRTHLNAQVSKLKQLIQSFQHESFMVN